MGCIAMKDVKKGTLILQEKPQCYAKSTTWRNIDFEGLIGTFQKLSPSEQNEYLQLYDRDWSWWYPTKFIWHALYSYYRVTKLDFFTFKKLIQVDLDHPVLCRIPLKLLFPMIDSVSKKTPVILPKNSKPSLEVVVVIMMKPWKLSSEF